MTGSRRTATVLRLACCLLAAAAPAAALDDDGQGWFPVTAQGPLVGDLRLFLEAQPRIGGNGMRQLLLRPALGYAVSPQWSLWQGYAWTPSFDPFEVEHRSWQQSLVQSTLGRVRLVNRTRFEQRFLDDVDAPSLRLRHMVRVVVPLEASRRWSFAAYDEAFATLNGTDGGPRSGFDQNRAWVGLVRKLTRHVNVEAGYLAQYVRRAGDDLLSHNGVLALDVSW